MKVQLALWMAVQELTAENRRLQQQNERHAVGLEQLRTRLEALQAE